MPKPTSTIYFSYLLDAVGDPIWNDISTYVKSYNIDRGKSNELDSYSTGTASVVLDNRTRAFEPEYASSPYYGQIEPYGKLRIVSGGYTEFVGVIDNWSFAYDNKGFNATAEIQANDNLASLAKNVLTDNVFAVQTSGNRINSVLYGSDIYYNEPTCIDIGTRNITGDSVYAGTNLLEYIQKVASNDGGLFFARRDGILSYQDTTLSNATGLPFTKKNLCQNSSFEVAISGGWSGGSRSTNWSEDRSYSYASSSFSPSVTYFETSATKYLIDTSYNISFYIKNGTAASKTLAVSAGMMNGSAPNQDTLSETSITLAANEEKRIDLGSFKTRLPTDGIYLSVSQFPLFTSNLFYIDAVLIEQNVVLNKYFDGASSFTAPALQTYAISFEGTADNSTSLWNTTVSTLADFTTSVLISDDNYAGINFSDLSMVYASEKLYNQITVNGVNNSTFSDPSSQSKYGLREYAITDSILDTQEDNDTLAKLLLALYRSPNYRAESISIDVHGLSASEQNTMLNMDLLAPIQLKFIPVRSGSALTKNYQVIGISHNVTQTEHFMVLKLTSLDNFGFILDIPALGVLDTHRLV